MSMVVRGARFILTYFKLNWLGAMEFRASFWSQVISMMINNSVWIVFWGIYFTRFPVVKGWELNDVLLLWGISAGAFGWVNILFGNILRVAHLVAHGQIDSYLTMPRNVLLHVLVSRMSFSAWGDLIFAWIIFFIAIPFSFGSLFLYIFAIVIGGLILGAMILLGQSLAFWIGNSEGIAAQLFNVMITFTTYPIDIFHGVTRVLLFTIVPAGFISFMPIALFKIWDTHFFFMLLIVSLIFVVLSIVVFYRGLKRYESGNMITLKM